MKKHYLFYVAFAISCFFAVSCEKAPGGGESSDAENAIISKAGQPEANAPYTIKLVEMENQFAPALQSFCIAPVGNQWLLVGGRTNGFHGFDPSGQTFPSKRSNNHFYVVDFDSSTTDSLPIPPQYLMQLQTTNMEGYVDGNTLYCIGGYGSNCAADSSTCYQTFPQLTAIDIKAAIKAVKSGDATGLANSITTINDERMRVTGGELHKIGKHFYLVGGQNFDTIYTGSNTGKYTDEIRRFEIEHKKGKLEIKNYTAYKSPWSGKWAGQFHRRDLVVTEAIMPNGNKGIGVYGGVFTPAFGSFNHPITISQNGNGKTSFTIDTVFKQKFCQYAAASIAMYNTANKTMYTTVLGGISEWVFDSTGTALDSSAAIPFINTLTTLAFNADSTTVEYPQKSPTLPGMIGAEAVFIPGKDIALYKDCQRVIDYAKLPAGNEVTLGIMYGGISAITSESGSLVPSTLPNNKMYKVILVRNQPAEQTAKTE